MLKGLDQLQRQLKEAQEVFKDLDGESFPMDCDPYDPASIDEAIQQFEAAIDERIGRHASNPIVGPMADEIKERYRAEILERAAAARLETDE